MKAAMSTPAAAEKTYSRSEIADAILRRLDDATVAAAAEQFGSSYPTQWFVVDDLLPAEMARRIFESFPDPADMQQRKTLREYKFVAAQMDRYEPQAEEALFAFQDPRVVKRIAAMTKFEELEADPKLYAGGISLMSRDNFLNPHLDNSHNHQRDRYRALNLLYYVSPDWNLESGGHLELWPRGLKSEPQMIPSLFNRFVVMSTGPESWHSVTTVRSQGIRCCVSNYYFSARPPGGAPYFRVTTFRGRPEQPVRDLLLRLDAALRQGLRKFRPQGIVGTKHLYRSPDEPKQ